MNYYLTAGQLDPTAYSPITTAFASAASNELERFYAGFILNKPYCLDELIQTVWQTPGYEQWGADFSRESLDALGEWFAARIRNVETVKDAAGGDLSDEVKSLAVAVGMYYGEVAVRNNPQLGWHQLKGHKKQADFGQPVISDSGKLPTNPVRVAHAFASGLAEGSKTAGQIRQTYDYWMQLIKSVQ